VDINNGDIIKAVRVSILIPFIFKPIKYNCYLLADSCLFNLLQNYIARKIGADIVTSINLDNKFFENKLNEDNLSILKTGAMALNTIHYNFEQYS